MQKRSRLKTGGNQSRRDGQRQFVHCSEHPTISDF